MYRENLQSSRKMSFLNGLKLNLFNLFYKTLDMTITKYLINEF